MIPLLNNFNLDSSGVAGFFGGDEAIAAMLTVHLYQGRRWLGWYNSSGGYSVAKYYGKLARTRILRGMYPGVRVEPVELFGLGGKKNPGFIAAHSGTFLGETGHLGFLLMKYCRGLKEEKGCKGGRQTTPVGVTVVTLRSPKGLDSTQPLPAAMYDKSVLFASVIPIGASLAACIACGVGRDWYALSMILLGMMANGIACCRIGSGVLMVNRIKPADNAGRGDGVLTSKNEVVIVRGPESAIAQVTRGSFLLSFGQSAPDYNDIGLCCFLLTTQLLLQLLLIPQANLFGQIMFLSSFAVSWMYNAYISTIDKDDIQMETLVEQSVLDIDKDELVRYKLGTRTTMAIFVLFILKPSDPLGMMNHLIPNETKIVLDNSATEEQGLVADLIRDAQHAYRCFREHEKRKEKATGATDIIRTTNMRNV